MTSQINAARIQNSIDRLITDLAIEKGSASHWTGELSTSALSTATAVSALAVCRDRFAQSRAGASRNADGSETKFHVHSDSFSSLSDDDQPEVWERLIENGSRWLAQAQNPDGGFGDTNRSLSNIATTFLVLAAWQLAGHNARFAAQIAMAWKYIERSGSWDGLRQRYGKDKTFVVPIMTNCALAGIVDWGKIPTLPFEAAALPQSWYRFAKMPVVSYAVPALVAIGQAQFFHRPPRNAILRFLRGLCIQPTRRVLTSMQPTSGGYLEAVPLTSFVLMSLGSIGQENSRVAIEARKFILNSVLADGSWPIDTNLATWVTSLASTPYYGCIARQTAMSEIDAKIEWGRTIDWLLTCQHVRRHPFTGADPGGWGWTNLSGAVPDADDTPAALLALKKWYDSVARYSTSNDAFEKVRAERVLKAASLGCRWLLRLQNRDGGWPTFCRGWGTLPFDRSGCDLTAHAIRALFAWRGHVSISHVSVDQAIARGWRYLSKNQNQDGSWLPLWFGNQDRGEEDNPVYGTGRVLKSFDDCKLATGDAFHRGRLFLLQLQNADGGWGGGKSIRYPARLAHQTTLDSAQTTSTIEETAVALEGIMSGTDTTSHSDSIMSGLRWLCESVEAGDHRTSQPIGFYFARLWYHERLYPMVFSLSALKKGLEICQR